MARILITGCDTGLGVEFARQYAELGHEVLATCLDPDKAEATRAIPGEVAVSKLDMSDLAAIDAFAAGLGASPLDILVNNAGIGRPHPPLQDTDYDNWRRILAVNLLGPTRLAATARRERRRERVEGDGLRVEPDGVRSRSTIAAAPMRTAPARRASTWW